MKIRIVIIVIMVVVAGILLFKKTPPPAPLATNFEECVKAGYPVLESFPEQCRTPDGKTFLRKLENKPTPTDPIEAKRDVIKLENLKVGDLIISPIAIKGSAKGWYFEASFPVEVLDANGKQLAITPAQAKSDWMVDDFVPFEVTLTFPKPETENGEIVFRKDNPSDDRSLDDELRVPIKFAQNLRKVNLYYYNAKNDKDSSGNILCSEKGLQAVERYLPVTKTPLQDTLNELIKGNLTDKEISLGITTEYPLPGFKLTGASLKSGVLMLSFEDPESKTTGGSCRVSILWNQIKKTALQFPEVKTVTFSPSELFQP